MQTQPTPTAPLTRSHHRYLLARVNDLATYLGEFVDSGEDLTDAELSDLTHEIECMLATLRGWQAEQAQQAEQQRDEHRALIQAELWLIEANAARRAL